MIQDNPYESTTFFRVEKCSECGVNMHANCHAHARYCSYYCSRDDEHEHDCNPHNTPIGEGLMILLIFVILYYGIKK